MIAVVLLVYVAPRSRSRLARRDAAIAKRAQPWQLLSVRRASRTTESTMRVALRLNTCHHEVLPFRTTSSVVEHLVCGMGVFITWSDHVHMNCCFDLRTTGCVGGAHRCVSRLQAEQQRLELHGNQLAVQCWRRMSPSPDQQPIACVRAKPGEPIMSPLNPLSNKKNCSCQTTQKFSTTGLIDARQAHGHKFA